MGILSRCFNWSAKKIRSPFAKLDSHICMYYQSKIYLGIQGRACLPVSSVEITFSISIRDGILAKIKSKSPYCIRFEYIDGKYFINDEERTCYQQLIAGLAEIQKEFNISQDCEALFPALEKKFFEFIVTNLLPE